MIPSSFQRGNRNNSQGGRSNLPLPVVIAGGVGLVLLAVVVWVLLSMGTAPVSEPVTADVPVQL